MYKRQTVSVKGATQTKPQHTHKIYFAEIFQNVHSCANNVLETKRYVNSNCITDSKTKRVSVCDSCKCFYVLTHTAVMPKGSEGQRKEVELWEQ